MIPNYNQFNKIPNQQINLQQQNKLKFTKPLPTSFASQDRAKISSRFNMNQPEQNIKNSQAGNKYIPKPPQTNLKSWASGNGKKRMI